MKYCRYCGKQIDDDSTFCTHCGMNQIVQNCSHPVEKIGGVVSHIWNKIKSPKGKLILSKDHTSSTFLRIKKWIKRIVIIFLVTTIIGLLVLVGFWLYGYYKTSKWTRDDERREIIAMKDISKADSIARVLFQEFADGDHRYEFNGNQCRYSHIEKGIEILRNAAEKGNGDAQFTLGCIYDGARYDLNYKEWDNKYTMMNTETNHERAAYWYSQASTHGNASAMGNLANSYRYGRGVEKDVVKATDLMRTAAEKGCSWAQLNYGDMLRDGEAWTSIMDSLSGRLAKIHLSKRIDIALLWWKKALKNGNKNAQLRLELLYENERPHEYINSLGKYTYTPDDIINGFNAQLIPNGIGKATFTDGRVYHGKINNGVFSGENAKFIFPNGDVYEGSFENNSFLKGKYTVKEDQSYFVGIFKNGNPYEGKWYNKDGSLITF